MSESYYGKPIVKPHVWKWFIPLYFWVGGMAGAASVQSAIARLTGRHRLATAQRNAAVAGALIAPALLIADLGVPQRFSNMFRVFKPTSPMSVGSWALGAFGGALAGSALADFTGRQRTSRGLELGAAAIGPVISVYTSVLIADTATPVWFEARDTLPYAFVANAVAAAGAAGSAFAPADEGAPARRVMIAGAFGSVTALRVMEHRLGSLLAEPYHRGSAGGYRRAAEALLLAGGAIGLIGGKRRRTMRLAAACVALGGICERFAITAAGTQSAHDPKYVVDSQRRRLPRSNGSSGSSDATPPSRRDRPRSAASA